MERLNIIILCYSIQIDFLPLPLLTVYLYCRKIQKDKNKPKIYAKQPHDLTHDVDSLRAFCIWWVRAPLPDRAKDDRPKWREDLIEDYKHASREIKELMIRELGEPRL